MLLIEEFRDIPGYEGLYQVSNLGSVKSLKFNKERILSLAKNSGGYLHFTASINNVKKDIFVHQLVAMVFLNHTPCGMELVIDHRNDIKTDNRVENLQVVTNRENSCKTQGKYSSKYKGVCWDKHAKTWVAQIHINGKQKKIGYFKSEEEASKEYQNKLKEITI